MITVVDCGIGNVGSILNMMRHLDIPATSTTDPEQVRTAEKLILPGIGAFDNGMSRLASHGMIEPLNDAVLGRKTPVLGICLGMQLLLDSSTEGSLPGLGWIKGRSVKFDLGANPDRLRVPHMGWSEITPARPGRLFPTTASNEPERFYFVHSYHVQCDIDADVAGIARHGITFHAAVERDNIFGVQFHPEKSHRFGMRLLTSFAKVGAC